MARWARLRIRLSSRGQGVRCGRYTVHLPKPALPLRAQFCQAPVVVFDGGDGLVQRDVEVVVEVAAGGGVPEDGPADALPERLDLG